MMNIVEIKVGSKVKRYSPDGRFEDVKILHWVPSLPTYFCYGQDRRSLWMIDAKLRHVYL